MKKVIYLLLSVTSSLLPVSAQQTIQELFVSMPENMAPLLTLNDRKEMVECWNQKLDTSVRNRLGGTSRVDTLAADYMKLHISDAETITLFLTKDNKDQSPLIGVVTTLYSPKGESTLEWYDTKWSRVTSSLNPELPKFGDGDFCLTEYVVDPKTKEIKTVYNYPLKSEQVDK